MDDFKKRLLSMKNKTKAERNKSGKEYMPYKKYYDDENEEEQEQEVILLNKKRLENSDKEELNQFIQKDKILEKEEKKSVSKEKDLKDNETKEENKEKEVNNDKDNKIINLKEEEEKENNIKDKDKDKDEGKDEEKKKEDEKPKKNRKYKLTIKPSYITIEKRDNTKKRVVDATQFSNEYKSNELFNWINIVLEDWEQYIIENLNDKRVKSNFVSKELEKYKQCTQNIRPLLNLLQERKLHQVILDKLFKVMVFAENRDLLNANDRYIDLSIGNAAWPMGLTMVGIHQRTGKSTVAPTQVAYILNDEETKKYLQSIRRILSFLQVRYNISPSQSVYN
jgi:pre-mRNA-splicing factor 18